MSKDEILDVVDKNGKVIGSAPRGECHNNPKLIHQVVHCWLFNKRGQVLWQQRSLIKDSSPGAWDMSCGGHVPSGEKPKDTLKRELAEELGIEKVDFHLVDKYVQGNDKQTELIYLYYAVVNRSANSFKLQKEEVEKVQWVDINEAQKKHVEGEVESTGWIISQVSKILQHVFSKHYSNKED